MENIPHWLVKQAELSPHNLAVEIDTGESLSYLELHQKSESYARKLSHFNFKKNDRVALLSNNSLDMLAIIHALSYLEVIVVLLNTRLTVEEINFQLKDSQTALLITSDEFQSENYDVVNRRLISDIVMYKVDYSIVFKSQMNLNDPFTLMYTSGTTGVPKAVVHTYGNHWWSAIGSVLNLGLNDSDKWLSALPMFHVGGLSVFIKSAIYGMPVYLLKKYSKKSVYQAILNKDVTIVSFVTLMLADFLKELSGDSPAQLRAILLGGGSVPEVLLEKCVEKNVPLIQSYGMTETCSQIVTLSNADAVRKIGSAGKPLMPAELKIDANKNEIGEILVKGPMVIERYFNNSHATTKSFKDGWFKTGDLGYLDEDGFLYVVDRRSDLIISGGENIYPTEIENLLMSDRRIKEVAVVAKKDGRFGAVPVAYVVLKEELEEPVDLSSILKGKLAKFKQPVEYIIVDTLPRTASNKIMRHQLSEGK